MIHKKQTLSKFFVLLIVALFCVSLVFAAYGPGDATASSSSSSSTSSSSTSSSSTSSTSSSSGGGSLPPSTEVVVAETSPTEDDSSEDTSIEVVQETTEQEVAVESEADESVVDAISNFAGKAFESAGKVIVDLSYLWIGVVLIAGVLFIAIGIRRHVKKK